MSLRKDKSGTAETGGAGPKPETDWQKPFEELPRGNICATYRVEGHIKRITLFKVFRMKKRTFLYVLVFGIVCRRLVELKAGGIQVSSYPVRQAQRRCRTTSPASI